ncbi:MAG: hypothetical protein JW763_08655 [candidate division Zixibacteria bacterium]|nr:hypothetical protein [candidate division Zixibacteria bacterium]
MHNSLRFPLIASVAVFAILMVCTPIVTEASPPPVWGELQPGEHAVGFKTIERYDYSRTFRCKHDIHGNPRDGERARPIQICIWYPAIADQDALPMVYSEYAFPTPENNDFFPLLSRMQETEIFGVLYPLLQNSYIYVNDILSLQFAAVRDASPATGRFPLIVYHSDIDASYCDNAILCEYLASHGFVVATTHSIGTALPYTEHTQRDLETIMRDREFAMAHLRDLPYVDPDHVGLLGNASGSLSSVLTRMRNTDIDAVAILSGWEYNDDYVTLAEENNYYDPACMRIPLLSIVPGELAPSDSDAVHAFHYAARYLGVIPGGTTRDVSIHNTFLSTLPDTANPDRPVGNPRYEATCKSALQFFTASLYDDPAALKSLQDRCNMPPDSEALLTMQCLYAVDAPPTEAEFVNAVNEEGGAVGREMYRKYCRDDTAEVFFRREIINAIGYQFLRDGNTVNASEMFHLSTEAFPTAAGSWLGLAYTHMNDEVYDSALVCLRKSLELIPADTAIAEERKPGLQGYIQGMIGRLQQPPEDDLH